MRLFFFLVTHIDGKPIEFDMDAFGRQLDKLYKAANLDSETIREEVKNIVPTYRAKRV